MDRNFEKCLIESMEIARNAKNSFLTTEHIFLAVIKRENAIVQKLVDNGVDILALERDLKELIERVFDKFADGDTEQKPVMHPKFQEVFFAAQKDNSFDCNEFVDYILNDKESISFKLLISHGLKLDEVGEDDDLLTVLNDMDFGAFVGRKKEKARAFQILSRKSNNNPLFVGESGVGKTALVYSLASDLKNGVDIPPNLKNCIIYQLNLAPLVSGTKFRGDFEERLEGILADLSEEENAILFIDEIGSILSRGDGENSFDASMILKPYLSSGKLRFIGTATFDEIKNKDKALLRRFNKVAVEEPKHDEAVEILDGISKEYGDFHGVKFEKATCELCVTLAKRYRSDKFLPDSAIDVLDEVGARAKIEGKKVSDELVRSVLGELTNAANLGEVKRQNELVLALKNRLKQSIFGQDDAIETVCSHLLCNAAGFGAADRPLGVFLLTGSSGVGKTQLTIDLAKAMNMNFERFDMSEYMEKHAVAKFIGSPPGYVGFENGGALTNAVKNHPYSVLLFDEVEKAHPELLNVLLQVFDSATLTDAAGSKSDFRNCIIVMTSNLGTKEAPVVGFYKNESVRDDNAVRDFFAPEFRNRLDAVVRFASLSEEALKGVVEKCRKTLEVGGVRVEFGDEAVSEILRRGKSDEFGARNIARVVKESVAMKLAPLVLSGEVSAKSVVKVGFESGEFKFELKDL